MAQPRRRPISTPRAATLISEEGRYRALLGLGCVLGLIARMLILREFLAENPIAEFPRSDAHHNWAVAGALARGEWIEPGPFMTAPLYFFVLAALRAIGLSLRDAYVVQILLHVATALLVAEATRARAGTRAGLLAAGLFLLLRDPAMSSTRLVSTTLQLFLGAAVWWSWARLIEGHDRGWRREATVGALMGVLALAWTPGIAIVAIYGVWLLGRDGGMRGWRSAIVGVAAAAVPIAPVTIQNWRVDHSLVLVSANAGITLRLGNSAAAQGVYTPIPGIRAARPAMFDDMEAAFVAEHGHRGTWAKVDRFHGAKAVAHWRDDPARAIVLAFKKLYWFAASTRYDDISFFHFERESGIADASVLTPLEIPWLLGLGALGLVAIVRSPGRFAPELAFFFLPLLVCVVFFYTMRYRLPIAGVLCGVCAVSITRWLTPMPSAGTRSVVVLSPLPLLVLNLVADPGEDPEMRASFTRYLSIGYEKQAEKRAMEGRLTEAMASYRSAIAIRPDSESAYVNLAAFHYRRDDLRSARRVAAAALQRGRSSVGLHRILYDLSVLDGDYGSASRWLRAVVESAPGDLPARQALTWFLATCPEAAARDGAGAVAHATALVGMLPEDPGTLLLLAAALAASERYDDAAATLARATAAVVPGEEHDAVFAILLDAVRESVRSERPARLTPLLVEIVFPVVD